MFRQPTVIPIRRPYAPLAVALAVALALLSSLFVRPSDVSAHPADRLIQHALITVGGDGVTVDIAISGGLLAVEGIAQRIDADRDGRFSPAEAQSWLGVFLDHLQVTQDGAPVSPEPGRVSLTLPDPTLFKLGLAPLTLRFSLLVAPDATTITRADITISNSYLLDLTDFRVDVFPGTGGILLVPVPPGKTMRLLVEIDPTQQGGGAPAAASPRWSASGVVAEANDLLAHERTPTFVAAMLALFVAMGGLHALQPGHGKTLVATWLVATGGTPRDAIVLAGIVTATHTLSVFALGAATLAASQWFLPSRVIPALGILSGALVAGMGGQMLWRSSARWRGTHLAKSRVNNYFPQSIGPLSSTYDGKSSQREAESHHHGHEHDAQQHPHEHHHALLDDAAHARAHLADIDTVYVLADPGAGGRRRVSLRQLVTLGISGGIAPCPDALAILLLAVGIGEAPFGMIAIVAFSLGLSVVLIAFGLAVALAGPAWRRVRATAGPRGEWMDRATAPLARFTALAPVISALVLLGLGLGLLWRALSL